MTGSNKKMNFPILKQIRINENQNKNWNPKKIRSYLNSSNNLDTLILKKMIKPFIQKAIKLNLEENEIIRIKQLYEEIINA